jgi:cellulose biosynthesis protein BcsQ
MAAEIEPEVEARAAKSIKKLRRAAEGYDLLVVDTRGLADELTTDVARESDVVFLPTGTSMDDATFLAGMQAWTAMFGLISFVLFGQLHNVVDDHDDFVRMSIDLIGRQVVGQQNVRQQGTGRRRRAVQTA